MYRNIARVALLAAVATLFSSCATAPRSEATYSQPALRDFAARVPTLRHEIATVTAAAQGSAERTMAHRDALLNVPYWEQVSFSEEMLNRAGGLAHAYPTGASGRNPPTSNDVVLLSVRSWEKEKDVVLRELAEFRANGWLTTVIASRAGCPAHLPADFFIDNGAPSGAAAQGRINVLANVTLGWMWCCEYVAAMTRKGKAPAVLLSVAMPGADEYDARIQTADGRHSIGDCDTAVPAGKLAGIYLDRIEELLADLSSRRRQRQLAQAAEVCAERMADGRTVGLSGVGHVILEEVKMETKAPWKGFQAVGSARTAFKTNLKPGDLLVWIAYVGMNSKYDDYRKYIAEAKVDLVTSFAPDPVFAKGAPRARAHIDQCWRLPDAEVPIPYQPGSMAPVSGVNAGLIVRMLDDEVAARLARWVYPD